jgi:hypothetical protein
MIWKILWHLLKRHYLQLVWFLDISRLFHITAVYFIYLIGTSWMNWTLLGSIGVGLLFMLAFPESYGRTDLDITIDVPGPSDSG